MRRRRQMSESAPGALRVLAKNGRQGFGFLRQTVYVFGLRKLIQPRVKGQEIRLEAQNRDQLLAHARHTRFLSPNQTELPQQEAISSQHQKDDEHKTKRQTRTDVEPSEAWNFHFGPLRRPTTSIVRRQ